MIAIGSGLIAWELWFFLGPRRGGGVAARSTRTGAQEIRVTVKGGYDPDTILVEAGRPVRLLFYRDETADCTERVVFDTLGIDQPLPPFQVTPIEFVPGEPGDYPFRCGMSMIRGRVVARKPGTEAPAPPGTGHGTHAH